MSHPRRQKIVRPGMQLRLVGSFVGLAALALVLQFLVLGYRLSDTVQTMDGDSGELADAIPGVVLETLLFSCAMLLPVLFAFGILLTHRIAGPLHRFESYLGALARGEVDTPCKIREGDQLQELCDVINEVSGELVELRGKRAETPAEPAAERRAA